MMTPLARAVLVPYQRSTEGEKVFLDEILLDFNPETLKIRYPGVTETSHSKGPAEVQVGRPGPASLSFSALFDTTRPPLLGTGGVGLSLSLGVGGGGPDVREKTKPLRELVLQDPSRLKRGGFRFVQFRWGGVLFSGILEGFTESLELFTADGTPVRSRLELKIEEHDLEREGSPEDRVSWSRQAGIGRRYNLGLSPGFGVSGGLSLGFSGGLGLGLGLSAGASLGVFGGAAVSAAFGEGVDLSLNLVGLPLARGGAADAAGATPTSWAPGGPAAGGAAAANAAALVQARAEGRAPLESADGGAGDDRATARASSDLAASGATGAAPGARPTVPRPVEPLPLIGSPPMRHAPVAGATPRPVYAPSPEIRTTDARPAGRPSWEGAPSATPQGAPRRCKW